MTTLILSAYGAVAPSYVNSPELGFPAGSFLGAAISPDRKTINTRNSNDLRNQSSTYGNPIPIVFPNYRVAGNIIWSDDMLGTQTGTGTSAVTTFTQSFAVGICEGPIVGVRRVWADNKLIYDTQSPVSGSGSAGLAFKAKGFRLYFGSENQLPDPLMESIEGVGNVPAHRGMAYLIIEDLDLTEFGNRLPVLNFEVVTTNGLLLKDVVTLVSERCGLSADDIDVSMLGASLHGYGILHMTGRNALEPLMQAFLFDAVESGEVVKFVLRGNPPVLTIAAEELLESA